MEKKMKFLFASLVICICISSCSKDADDDDEGGGPEPTEIVREDTLIYTTDQVETFTFFSDGDEMEGLIYLPESYDTNGSLPTIYLIDYQETHFAVVKDEFAQLIHAVRENSNIDALVVTTKELPKIDAAPFTFEQDIAVYENLASYVDSNYTDNTSRTFIGRGSEGGVVLLALLKEDPEANVFENYIATDSPESFLDAVMNMIENGDVPENMLNKKLHYSYTSSANEANQEQLINSIANEQFPWLAFTSVHYWSSEFPDAYPQAFADGLQYVFN